MGKLVAPLTLHFPRICWVAAPNIIMTLKVSRIAMLSAAKTGPKRNGTSRSRPKAECIYLGKGLDWVRMDQVWVGVCMCTYILHIIYFVLLCLCCFSTCSGSTSVIRYFFLANTPNRSIHLFPLEKPERRRTRKPTTGSQMMSGIVRGSEWIR